MKELIKAVHGNEVVELKETGTIDGDYYLVTRHTIEPDGVPYSRPYKFFQTFLSLKEAKYEFYRQLMAFEAQHYCDDKKISVEAMLDELK